MPRFMPVPKLAVGPVTEPSAPTVTGAAPAAGVANSAHESVVPPAAGALTAAGGWAAVVGFGAAAGAAGALVAAGAAAGLHAASAREKAESRAKRSIADGPPL